uniref:Uncharacterized protein n=1 Tax=Amphimedon queenslandica TaxID=400682 RepID=A0A1X7VU11_AMPQE
MMAYATDTKYSLLFEHPLTKSSCHGPIPTQWISLGTFLSFLYG